VSLIFLALKGIYRLANPALAESRRDDLPQ
jgi:hypothetical protein